MELLFVTGSTVVASSHLVTGSRAQRLLEPQPKGFSARGIPGLMEAVGGSSPGGSTARALWVSESSTTHEHNLPAT